MGMRDYDGFHGEAVSRDNFEDAGDLVAGVDYDGLACLLVAENRAIALQHSYRKHFVNHQPDCIL
jgi:hypothetical protein